ncbi:MAG: CpXC domain-containing protein, partial [Ardenticatenaceae bacterium]
MAYPTSRISTQCPQCGAPLTMAAQQVIDVGEEPTLRDRLLRGRLNVLQCPNCGARTPIAVPMLYHDPEKQLLFAYMPNQMQLTMEQEEKEIGRLANLVLNHTPPEKRKSYLLTPTRVMSYEGLVEKILEAEGISPEEMRRQTNKIQLVMRMAQAVGNEDRLTALIEEHKEQIDRGLLTLIAATMQQAAESQDEETVRRYRALRDKIVKQLDLKAEEVPSLSVEEAYDALIGTLLELPEERLQGAVATNRPLMDYNFFMHLTQRADQAGDEEKQKLLTLRKTLVALTDEMDQLAETAMRRAAEQLNTLLRAEDIDAKIEEMYPHLDEAFLVVLSANVEQAKAQGREEIVEVLTRIYHRVVDA